MEGMPKKWKVYLALLVAAGLLAAGCSLGVTSRQETLVKPTTGPTSAPTATVRAGWAEYQRMADGFAVALPGSWRAVDVNPETLAQALRALSEHNPQLSALLSANRQRLLESGISFFAFDLSPESLGSASMTTLNILHQPLDGNTSLAEFGRSNVQELEKIARVVKPVSQEMVRLPASEALRLRYQLAIQSEGDQELSLSLTQYLLVKDDEGYVLTFATLPSQQERYESVFDSIVGSFRWLEQRP